MQIRKDQRLRGRDSSGGGYGDPLTRDPLRVLTDVLEGYESLGKARDVYGVVFTGRIEDDSLAGGRGRYASAPGRACRAAESAWTGAGSRVASAVRQEPTMSIFAVNHLCREVLRDHAFRAAMKADPAKALAPLDLTDEERRALIAGDVGALYRMGVNGFLMGYLARYEVCGLNIEIYNQRMRAVKVDELGQPVA